MPDFQITPGSRLAARSSLIACSALLIATLELSGQSTPTLNELHELVLSGNTAGLRRQLPALSGLFADDPGYIYLQGCAEEDGDRAIRFYQTVLNLHPQSEWADDALYRLYQYSYAVGAYSAADGYISRLRVEYPASPHGSAERKAPQTPPPAAGTALFAVQVGAFTEAEDAEHLAEKLKREKYTVEVRPKRVGDRALHAVWVGRLPSRQDARNLAARLKSHHKLDGLVVRFE